MPEIKHTFQGGKMSKDIDERLVRNGEYRDAMNIQVRTTSGDAAGTVQNIQGNEIIDTAYDSSFQLYNSDDSKIIASVADEKNDKAYFFIAAPEVRAFLIGTDIVNIINTISREYVFIDSIVEVDSGGAGGNTSMQPVVVDKYAIIDSAAVHADGTPGVLSSSYNFPITQWISFDVADGSKYRVGMNVRAFNSNGENMFTPNAKIRKIENNTITLYNQQNGIAINNTPVVFIFEHYDRPLNFRNNKNITGINIIDNLLFWTDNRSEPKKINIEKCKSGSVDYVSHTKFRVTNFDANSDNAFSIVNTGLAVPPGIVLNQDLKEEHLVVIRQAPKTPPTLSMQRTSRSGNTSVDLFNTNFLNSEGNSVQLNDEITISDSALSTTDFRPDDIISIVEDTTDEDALSLKVKLISYVDILGDFTNSPTDNIFVQVISVNNALNDVLRDWTLELELKKPLFEKKFGRFGYRYKYDDGEYSAFSPWSELAFLPGEYDYLPRKGYNLGMANELRELIVRDFIPINTDRQYDVVSVDILYKTTDNANVYVVKTITRGVDEEWGLFTPSNVNDELLTGQVIITSEMIHRVLPANQMLRTWDNVPRYALAQEITANRLLYGNYTQGYPISFKLGITPIIKKGETPTLINPLKSIKSIRSYKVGAVFGDKYGRETPVVESGYIGDEASSTGDLNVPKSLAHHQNLLHINNDWSQDPPPWTDYVKYYIKETSNEYYNLVMDRWYDAEDGNIWISFNSADRNKVDEETYLVLKNSNGDSGVVQEKARYKILAIENEAPDYIKIDHRYMGEIELNPYSVEMFTATISTSTVQPNLLMAATSFEIGASEWDDLIPENWQRKGHLRVRFSGRRYDGDVLVNHLETQWVTVNNYSVDTGVDNEGTGDCTLHWSEPFEEDVDMYTRFLNLGYDLGSDNDLKYVIEIKEDVVENKPEFDGRFFVKIEKDVTVEQHIMLMAPMVKEWGITHSFTISYISTQPVNPALNGPYSTAEATGSDSDVAAKTQWGGGMLDTGNAAPDWPGDSFVASDDWDSNNSSNTPSIHDFALGCRNNTGNDDTTWSAVAGSNTRDYWSAWLQHVQDTSASDDEPNGENRIFIDNSRCHIWKWETGDIVGSGSSAYNNYLESEFGLTNTNLQGWGYYQWEPTFWEDDLQTYRVPNYNTIVESGGDIYNCGGWCTGCMNDNSKWVNTDLTDNCYGCGAGSNPAMYSGWFYRPYGFDSTPDNGTDTFNRITFSVIGSDWPSNTEAGEFRAMMYPGNFFRFAGDPLSVYEVVSAMFTEIGSGSEWNYTVPEVGLDVDFGGGQYWSRNYMGCHNGGCCCGDADECDDSQGHTATYVAITGDTDEAGSWYSSGIRYHYLPTWDDSINGGSARLMKASCKYGQYSDSEESKRISMRVVIKKIDPDTGIPFTDNRGIEYDVWDPRGRMRHDGTTSMTLQFLTKYETGGGMIEDPNHAACWETEPKKDVDLDLYYEASHALPIRLREGNTLSFAPINSRVTAANIVNNEVSPINLLNYGDDVTTDTVEDNFQINTGFHHVENVYYTADTSIVQINCLNLDMTLLSNSPPEVLQRHSIGIGSNLYFLHRDGTRTTSKVTDFYHVEPDIIPVDRIPRSIAYVGNSSFNQIQINDTGGVNTGMIVVGDGVPPGIWIKNFGGDDIQLSDTLWMDQTGATVYNIELLEGTGYYELDSDVYKYEVTLPWFNCYSFGNGVESDRIRDDFNAPMIDNGVKVSTTFSGYGVEKKTSGIIYSGLYNSISEINDLNEFNMSEKITKDLNPSYGSIQALKTRNTDVVVLTQDKILKVLANKDAVYNADGNPQLIATNRTLGQTVPFAGDFGISNNPESLAWDQFRLYFTDTQRGAVLRLSGDGLTPISNVGMKTWFRDNLKKTNTLLGTFDVINGEYNLTLDYNTNDDDVTVSFNEGSKGWVSFKSFVPQAGVSVSDKYITGLKSSTYEHYVEQVPELDENGQETGNMLDNYNTFYGTHTESSVSILFNDQPGSVKSFQAVNYEGSQAKVNEYTQSSVTDEAGNLLSNLTDGEYYNLSPKTGWYAYSFETDMQEGNIPEFRAKENKWFNKINGIETNLGNLDTNEFSVQGIGIPIEVEYDEPPPPPEPDPVYGCTDPIAENYNSLADTDDGTCEYIYGCTVSSALNYNAAATMPCNDFGEPNDCCQYPEEEPDPIYGCMDDGTLLLSNGDQYDSPYPGIPALNYNSLATVDNGTCLYPVEEPEPIPEYINITVQPSMIQEGNCATVTITSQNVAAGTMAGWQINATIPESNTTTAQDYMVDGVCLQEGDDFPSGEAEIQIDGTATFEICTCADETTEGLETSTISIVSSSDGTSVLDDASGDYITTGFMIDDTSQTPDLNQSTLTVQDLGDEP